MAGKRRGKSTTQPVPVAGDSSCPSGVGVDEPGMNSTCNPNLDSLQWQWETFTEEQLEKIIRKKLDDLYRKALSILVSLVFDEDIALKGLLERGYCIGKTDSLTSAVENSLDFLTGKEENQLQPFQNLELLVEFNLQFMVYILQKYNPNLNRISACRCILMNDLKMNRAILMDVNDHTIEMLSNLNLDDDEVHEDDINVDKDRFLALEIREMLNNLNVLDESVCEDMKDMMIANSQKTIDDLEVHLKERIRWASKKVAQSRRNPTVPVMNLQEEIQIIRKYTEIMLSKKESVLSSMDNEFDNAANAVNCLKIVQGEIRAALGASLSIQMETDKKCFELSKRYRTKMRLKSWGKQRLKLLEVVDMEKQKISKWSQQLDENDSVIIQTMLKLKEITNTREAAIARFKKGKCRALERFANFKLRIEVMKSRGITETLDVLKDDMLMVEKMLKK